jgi:hypothetical protein
MLILTRSRLHFHLQTGRDWRWHLRLHWQIPMRIRTLMLMPMPILTRKQILMRLPKHFLRHLDLN